jgi:sialate O-acetylesterase
MDQTVENGMAVRKRMKKIFFILLLAIAGAAPAEVKPAGVFTDKAVLQQQEPVRIWGVADPGETVTVCFAGQKQQSVADPSGKWMVTLAAMPACSEGRTLRLEGSQTPAAVELSDVLVGEVWLAGGQSNMASPMRNYSRTTQPDIDSANDPLLRMMTIPGLVYAGQNDNRPVWQESTPENAAGFSASAYYFAKNLREVLHVPVGIVSCSVGGTPAEAWMSRKTMESRPEFRRVLDAYEKGYAKNFPDEESYIKADDEYKAAYAAYRQKKAEGEDPGPFPVCPMGPRNFSRPVSLHELMLSQTIPCTIRGVIWYQGENNAYVASAYRDVFTALIGEWREEFLKPDLPFLFVQLATFGPANDQSTNWPELRDVQRQVNEDTGHTGMVVLVDGGEENDIHPHTKDKVGRRLSLLARNLVYGEKDLVCEGPKLQSVSHKEKSLELTFSHTGSGLELRTEPVSAFEVAGADGRFVPADAQLKDGKILLGSSQVDTPEFVRYGWKKWFVPTLLNHEGLPAGPFRTDSLPFATEGRYLLGDL